jgi:hypothetical protein
MKTYPAVMHSVASPSLKRRSKKIECALREMDSKGKAHGGIISDVM